MVTMDLKASKVLKEMTDVLPSLPLKMVIGILTARILVLAQLMDRKEMMDYLLTKST